MYTSPLIIDYQSRMILNNKPIGQNFENDITYERFRDKVDFFADMVTQG